MERFDFVIRSWSDPSLGVAAAGFVVALPAPRVAGSRAELLSPLLSRSDR